eukprot:9235069-Alexandrium_andersonii.AAC.1
MDSAEGSLVRGRRGSDLCRIGNAGGDKHAPLLRAHAGRPARSDDGHDLGLHLGADGLPSGSTE